MKKRLSILVVLLIYFVACDNFANESNEENFIDFEKESFTADSLLFSYYYAFDIGTLNLSAPANCKKYEWILTDSEDVDSSSPISVTYFGGTTQTIWRKQNLIICIPDSGLESPHTYKITLSVTDKNNTVYTDSALFYIVEYKYFY